MQNLIENKKNYLHAPYSIMNKLDNLFFYLNNFKLDEKTSFYKPKQLNNTPNEVLGIDKIKSAIIETKNENVKSLYLIGTEPLLHPDYNKILRLCLKFNNTTVITNGGLINEKKARFLRKIDDESQFETIYRINLSHWEEEKNDKIRGYGNFRRTVCAINSLVKYEFNPIINFINIYKESKEDILISFFELFKKYNFNFEEINLKLIEPENNFIKNNSQDTSEYDCQTSRVISRRGVFACPQLCNDFRARVGSDMKDFSNKICLDTEKCSHCINLGKKVFVNDWIK